MNFARSKALRPVTHCEAVTLEKSSVTAKCHCAKLLPIKLFLSAMTLVTLYCTDKVYRGENSKKTCMRKINLNTYIRTCEKRKCHLSCVTSTLLAATTATSFPVAIINNNL